MQPFEDKRVKVLLLLVLVLTYLYGVHYLPLRGEEANRILTAYEMVYFHDWFNLTHLGEPYYSKPPLFMWLIALFSNLFGWSQETARLISVLSSFFTALLVYVFSLKVFKNRAIATLSSLILLTFGDLILFYGFVAEIDAFHMFLFTLSVVAIFLFLSKNRDILAYATAGLFTALLFLTKGLPAFYHLPVTFLILLIYFNKWKSIFSPKPLIGLASLMVPLSVWYFNLKNPNIYLTTLWNESFRRTPLGDEKIKLILKHLVVYPLLNFRQMLPHSFYVFFNFKKVWYIFTNFPKKEILLIMGISLINYLPYLISPGARGRYLLIVFPFLAILFSLLLNEFLIKRIHFFKYTFIGLVFLSITAWFLALKNLPFFEIYGFLPLVMVGLFITFSIFLMYRFQTWLIFTVLLIAVVKFGYINYYAPFKEKKHPAREIAISLASAIPRGAVIRYIPKEINMELCAYTDLYTKGIVLRNKGKYFLTTVNDLPKGNYKILKTYKGWVIGILKTE
ncbi:MAG TPA: hypothetical protein EYO62_05635 [Aquificales bacterium]|nr:hypothetical protein [Aquificales bacterium]